MPRFSLSKRKSEVCHACRSDLSASVGAAFDVPAHQASGGVAGGNGGTASRWLTSLSAIALRLGGGATLKHRLKSVDRLLGNTGLHLAWVELYRCIALRWLEDLPQILIVVDWSDLTLDQRWQLLRASVVVDGRSVTLYEEVHPQKRLANPGVHRKFLRRLAQILPPGYKPIVMTDAGFHAPWFKRVNAQGWEFVGRIRGRNRLQFGQDGDWIPARDL